MSLYIIGANEKTVDIIAKRDKIVRDYCEKMGWPCDATQLSIEQIMEIRKQPEWVAAGK
jgi:hypothetical protein